VIFDAETQRERRGAEDGETTAFLKTFSKVFSDVLCVSALPLRLGVKIS
jgi:hypothetical protein